LEPVSGGPAIASEVPAQATSMIAIPRLQARRGAMTAAHLTVETGNRDAIDLSLKIRLKKSLSIGPLHAGETSEELETVWGALCQRVRVRNRSRLQKNGRIRLKRGILLTSGVCATGAGPMPAMVLSVRSTS
jgi:hypothetical protein